MEDPSFITNKLNLLTSQSNTVFGMNEVTVWILIGILLLISGLYSASENTYTNCNKYHFKTLSKNGSFTAKLILRLIEKFDNTLITILIGNNIIQTLMSFMSAMLFYNMSITFNWSDGVEAIVSTISMAFLIYIVSDTCPKILSKAIPNKMAYVLVYPVTITNIILYPIIMIFKGILFLVHKIFRIKDENLLSKEDILNQAKLAINDETISQDENQEEEKLFEKNEEEILDNAFSFDKKLVKDIFIPLDKVTMLDITNLSIEELNKKLITIPYTRIPIYEKDKTNIIGILVLKSYFEKYVEDEHLNIISTLEDVVEIDINLPIDDAFRELNTKKVHLGIVKNKSSVLGIITMEDILEELIDDIDEKKISNLKGVK